MGKSSQGKFSRIRASGLLVWRGLQLPCRSRGARSLAEQGDVRSLDEQGFHERLDRLIRKILMRMVADINSGYKLSPGKGEG